MIWKGIGENNEGHMLESVGHARVYAVETPDNTALHYGLPCQL